jgi:cyclic pyranopterin phosphate synthase
VALKGINDTELIEMAQLSFRYPFHIRFIEYMPIGQSDFKPDTLLLAPEIKSRISAIGKLIPVQGAEHDGPAQRYKFEQAKGEIGFIAALSQHFCNKCNRLRLTASGQLRPCLLSDHQEDLKVHLRQGCSDQEIADIFFTAVKHKPSDHNLASQNPMRIGGQMRMIGG